MTKSGVATRDGNASDEVENVFAVTLSVLDQPGDIKSVLIKSMIASTSSC